MNFQKFPNLYVEKETEFVPKKSLDSTSLNYDFVTYTPKIITIIIIIIIIITVFRIFLIYNSYNNKDIHTM
jgi:hypothetical protein